MRHKEFFRYDHDFRSVADKTQHWLVMVYEVADTLEMNAVKVMYTGSDQRLKVDSFMAIIGRW